MCTYRGYHSDRVLSRGLEYEEEVVRDRGGEAHMCRSREGGRRREKVEQNPTHILRPREGWEVAGGDGRKAGGRDARDFNKERLCKDLRSLSEHSV